MKRSEALAWLNRLLKSKNEQVRQMAYSRLHELLTLLLPEDENNE